jgi:hypothetical protein
MKKAPFRIAMREEGEWVRVYLADIGTMEDALELVTIRTALLDVDHPALRDKLLELVQQGVGKICAEEGAEPESWTRMTAPGHERRQ